MEQFNHDGLYVLSLEEIETYNGGFVPVAVAAALGFAAGVLFAAAVTDWQDVREGWYDGINGYPPRHQTKPAGK